MPDTVQTPRLAIGAQLDEIWTSHFTLPATRQSPITVDWANGAPSLIAFHRFAECPFCTLRMRELMTRAHELPATFRILVLYDSPIEHLKKYMAKHQPRFPIAADPQRLLFERFHIEQSFLRTCTGALKRLPTLFKAMFQGYIPLSFQGSVTSLPADFIFDSQGKLALAHYGKEEGDHLDFATIAETARNLAKQTPSANE